MQDHRSVEHGDHVLTAREVDVEKMCAETAGYFTPVQVEAAFARPLFTGAWRETKRLLGDKGLAEALDCYGHQTYVMGGDYQNAAIRWFAQFFPMNRE